MRISNGEVGLGLGLGRDLQVCLQPSPEIGSASRRNPSPAFHRPPPQLSYHQLRSPRPLRALTSNPARPRSSVLGSRQPWVGRTGGLLLMPTTAGKKHVFQTVIPAFLCGATQAAAALWVVVGPCCTLATHKVASSGGAWVLCSGAGNPLKPLFKSVLGLV